MGEADRVIGDGEKVFFSVVADRQQCLPEASLSLLAGEVAGNGLGFVSGRQAVTRFDHGTKQIGTVLVHPAITQEKPSPDDGETRQRCY